MKTPARHCQGFTLIDMAILITVLAMLAATFLSSQKVARDDFVVTDTNAKMNRIQDALQFFYQNKGFLPCPAFNTANISSPATYRIAGDCTTTLSTATDPTAGYDATPVYAPSSTNHTSADTVRIGALPTRSLGLPDSDGVDRWGGVIKYAVIKNLTSASGFSAWTQNSSLPDSVIRVVDAGGNDKVPAGIAGQTAPTGVIAYVLWSGGPEHMGIYSDNGTLISACSGSSPDSYNCTGNANYGQIAKFYEGTVNETPGSSFFLNILRWRLLSDVGG